MIYIVAILLFILVLANEKARDILFALISSSLFLAIVGAVLIGLAIGVYWIFKKATSNPPPASVQKQVYRPMSSAFAPPPPVSQDIPPHSN
jgi:hypothetical protein